MADIADFDVENYLARFELRGFNLSSFVRPEGPEYHAVRLLPQGRLDIWARATREDDRAIARIEAAAWEFGDRMENVSVQLEFLSQTVDLRVPGSNSEAAAEWVLSRGPWIGVGEATSELFGAILVRLMGQRDGRAVSILPAEHDEPRRKPHSSTEVT